MTTSRQYILDLSVTDDAPNDGLFQSDRSRGAPEQLLDWLTSDGGLPIPSWVSTIECRRHPAERTMSDELRGTERHYRVVCSGCANGMHFYEGPDRAEAEERMATLRQIKGHDMRIEWADIAPIEWHSESES